VKEYVGNRNIRIKTIGFLLGNLIYIHKRTLCESQIILMQGETTSQYFNIDEIIAKIKESNISSSVTIRAFIEDTEGQRLKKRLIKAGNLIKMTT